MNYVFHITVPTKPPNEDKEEERASSSESPNLIRKGLRDPSIKSNNQSSSKILLKNAYVKVERLLNVSSLQIFDEAELECQRVDKLRNSSGEKSKPEKLDNSLETECQQVTVGKPSEKSERKKVSSNSSLAEFEAQDHLLRNGEIKTSKTKKSLQDIMKTKETKKVSQTQPIEKSDASISRSDVLLRKRSDRKNFDVDKTSQKDGCDINLELHNEIKTQNDLDKTLTFSKIKRTRFADKTIVNNLESMKDEINDAAKELPQKRRTKKLVTKKKECDVPKLENGEKKSSLRKPLTKFDTKLSNFGEVSSQIPAKESNELLLTRTRRQLKRNCTENQEEKNLDLAHDVKQPKLQMEVTEPNLNMTITVRHSKRKLLEKVEDTNTEPILNKVENSKSEEKVTRQSKRKMQEKLQEMNNSPELEDEQNTTKKQSEKKILPKTDFTEINKSPEKLRKSSRIPSKRTEQNIHVPETTDAPELRLQRPKRKKAISNEEENIDSKKPTSENSRTNNAQALRSLRVLRPKKKHNSVLQVSKSIMTEDCQEDLPQLTLSNNEHILKEMNGLNSSTTEATEDQEVENHMKNPNLESPKKVTRKLLRSPRLRLGQKKEVQEMMPSVESKASLESSVIFKNTKMPILHMKISEQPEKKNTPAISPKGKTAVEETRDKELGSVVPLSDKDVNDQEQESCVPLPTLRLENEIIPETPESVVQRHEDSDKAEPASEELEIEDGATSNQEIEDIGNIDHQVDMMLSEVNKELDELDKPEIRSVKEFVGGKKVLHESILPEGSENSEEIEIIDQNFDETVENEKFQIDDLAENELLQDDETAEDERSQSDEIAKNNLPQNGEIVEREKSQFDEAAENELSQNDATSDNDKSQSEEIVEIGKPQSNKVLELEKSQSDKILEIRKNRNNNTTDIENNKNPPDSSENGETPVFNINESITVTESELCRKDKGSVEATNNPVQTDVPITINDNPTSKSKIIQTSSITDNLVSLHYNKIFKYPKFRQY